jgi:hypothetical protein
LDGPSQRVERTNFVRRELDVYRGGIFFHSLDACRSWNRNNMLALSEYPGQCDLGGCRFFRLGECTDALDDVEILIEVLGCKAR